MSSKGILAAAVIVVGLQEAPPWRVVFNQEGKLHSVREDGSDKRGVDIEANPVSGLSPDGRRRVFTRSIGGSDCGIYTTDAKGDNETRLTGASFDDSPSWTSDGKRIVFRSNRTGKPQVWIMEADGKNPGKLTDHPEGVRNPVVSSAADRVAYQELLPERGKLPPTTLRTIDLSGRDGKILLERTQMLGAAWSPKGETLAVSLVGEVRILDLLGKPVKSFDLKSVHKDLGAHAAYDVIWRPDGGALACAIRFLGGRTGGAKLFGDDQIFILPMEGKPVVIEAGGPASPVRWIR